VEALHQLQLLAKALCLKAALLKQLSAFHPHPRLVMWGMASE
jgi:hypothetical protein